MDFARSSLDSLMQANATVFALVFTIPLAAAEFSRYEVSPRSFFDLLNTAFLMLFGATVFLPLVFYQESWAPFLIGLSATSMALVFPFLFRGAERLRPTSIVNQVKVRIRKKWIKGEPESAIELGDLAHQALGHRDYDTFSKVVSSLCELLPIWKSMKISLACDRLDPLQLRVAGLDAILKRVGEESLVNSNTLKTYCFQILDIRTLKLRDIDENNSFEKRIEFQLLSNIAKPDLPPSITRIVLMYIAGWCALNRYIKKMDEDRAIDSCAYLYLERPEELVSEVLEHVRIQIRHSLTWSGEDVCVIPSFEVLPLKHDAERMISKLQVRLDELRWNRELEELRRRSSTTVSPSIVSADETDAKKILSLQRIAYRQTANAYDDYLILPLCETTLEITKELERKIFLKAVIDNILVGCIRTKADGTRCRISRLVVHPDFRGRDIEEKLLRHVERIDPSNESFEAIVYDKSQDRDIFEKLGYRIMDKVSLSDRIAMLHLEKVKTQKAAQFPQIKA